MVERKHIPGPEERGFTVLEVLIALTIMVIGITGLISMQVSSQRASAFSRHATEASHLGEDKLEELRLLPSANLANGTDTVNALGEETGGDDAIFTRTWTVALTGTVANIEVLVSWEERGDDYTLTFQTERLQ